MRTIAVFVGVLFAVVGLAVFLWVSQVAVEEPPLREVAQASVPAAYLGDTESRVLTSSITGREYQISVALPFGYAESTDTYPVLYGVDANGQFGTLVEAARMLRIGDPQIPQLLIVGIGYPYGGRQISAEPHRIVDFFPALDREWIDEVSPSWPEAEASYDVGHGEGFLSFIREELFPLIETEYRTDPTDRALYGHSGGGWFGLYALLEGEGAFQRAIIGSPSLWWDGGSMFQLEESYAQTHTALPARAFLSVGSDEDSAETEQRYGMARNLRRLVEILERRQYEGLEWRYHYFEDENHQSVVGPTISRGLRYIYGEGQ